MHKRSRPKKLNKSIKPDFPSLADEIALPRPDMNIKVAAITVSKKSINTCTLRDIKLTFCGCCSASFAAACAPAPDTEIMKGHTK